MKSCVTGRWLILAMALLVATGGRAATPPMVGENAPAFALQTLEGETIALSSLTTRTPVVLLMLRGFPGYQCPLCTRQVRDFVVHAEHFATKGARVVMIYPGPAPELRARAKEFLADQTWPKDFIFLLDPDYAFTNAYRLRWDARNETAFPATFIIGTDGNVRFAKVSTTHGGRTSAAEVLEKL